MEFLWTKIETLLLLVIILLQLVLIFLVLRRGEPRLVFEGLGIRREPRKEITEIRDASLENLWENPPPASEELKSTIAEFKDKYNRSEPWDGDFVL